MKVGDAEVFPRRDGESEMGKVSREEGEESLQRRHGSEMQSG